MKNKENDTVLNPKYQQFQQIVLDYYQAHSRNNLPWRIDTSPYRVLVSEVMLQQTQVERVIPFFNRWMANFSSWEALANAPQTRVLSIWKGLGYNSRALRLQQLAKTVTDDYDGMLPTDFKELCALPGIGAYTGAAVRAFAFNLYTPLIETNVRRVFIHHFFADQHDVKDSDILDIINEIGEVENPRQWYSALMDYGTTLPKVLKKNPNRRSQHYTKQSQFIGSDRQIRGALLDILLVAKKHTMGKTALLKKLMETLGGQESDYQRYEKIIDDLVAEEFMRVEKRSYQLVD